MPFSVSLKLPLLWYASPGINALGATRPQLPTLLFPCPHGEPELRRAFEGWLEEVILPRLDATADEIPKRLTLEEIESMLAERIDSWNEQLRKESLQQGLQQGEAKALLRLLEKRFGPLDQATRDRIAAADADLLLERIDRFPAAESLTDALGS